MDSQGLQVIIVGAGIGGLAAAIALRQGGHHVKVYEKASLLHEIGQGITFSPNGGRILQDLGVDFERAGIADYLGTNVVDAASFKPLAPPHDFSHYDEEFGMRMKTAYRIDVHAALLDRACSKTGPGAPVQIYTQSGATDFDCLNGTITLDSGETVQGDLVVAADGVRSHAAAHINGPGCPELESSGTVVYRFTITCDRVRSDPETAPLLAAGDGFCTFYVHPEQRVWLVQYYCRNNKILNFALYRLREMDDDKLKEHELRYKTDSASLRREMEGFHPALLKVASMANDVLPLWRCTTREPLQALHRGRMVVMGDASHPVFPHIGLGAVSAIEDAGFLGRLFRNFPDEVDKTAAIAQRLGLFSRYRIPRVAAYKYYSDVPYFRNTVEEQKEKVNRYMDSSQMPESQAQLRPWYMSYDAIADAERALKEAGLC